MAPWSGVFISESSAFFWGTLGSKVQEVSTLPVGHLRPTTAQPSTTTTLPTALWTNGDAVLSREERAPSSHRQMSSQRSHQTSKDQREGEASPTPNCLMPEQQVTQKP